MSICSLLLRIIIKRGTEFSVMVMVIYGSGHMYHQRNIIPNEEKKDLYLECRFFKLLNGV